MDRRRAAGDISLLTVDIHQITSAVNVCIMGPIERMIETASEMVKRGDATSAFL